MIHVAGGTYLEHCREPHWYELYGSGLRAGMALARLKTPVRLSTFVGDEQEEVLRAKAEGIDLEVSKTRETVIFSYLHPLSKPAIEPDIYARACDRNPKEVKIQAEKVLRFGMVEGSAVVKAKMVTYDPQTPSDPRAFTENGSQADRLAVVANRVEARQLTGEADPESACKAILAQGAEVAVVKCGTAGCIVGTAGHTVHVEAYRTSRVWPIGSGDVFSAMFAYAWMEVGLDPPQAATFASKGASHYIESQLFARQEDIATHSRKPLRRLSPENHKKVYLAGPFFNLPQRWLIEEFRFGLLEAGVRVFSPLHDVGRGDPEVIYGPDMDGLRDCGVLLACLDGLDPGTIYEVGYAHSLGLKVIGFVSAERQEDLKMIIGGGSQVTNDFATALYLTVWGASCE